MRSWLAFFSCTVLLVFTFSRTLPVRFLNSEEEEKVAAIVSSKTSCLGIFKQLAYMVADKSSLIALTALGAWAGSEWVGQQTETPLVGLSIYLDYEEVLHQLSPKERAVLEAKERNTLEIVRVLNARLSNKSGEKLDLWPYLNPLMASSYLGENPPEANVCRHKALILQAILNHLNIPAKLVTGNVKGDSGRSDHVWVYLPEINKVADPMNNLILPPSDYEKLFEAKVNFGIIQLAKPVGIMAR